MAPVDAERLRRGIVTYATLAMVVVGVVVAALAITPLAMRLREQAQDGLRHELALKVLAGGEVVSRAVNLAQQVTSRTVIRQKLEAYNQGQTSLAELRDFTRDKLADALNLSPELLGVLRVAADGQEVARLGRLTGTETVAPLSRAEMHLSLRQGDSGPVLVVAAPIVGRGGALAGTDLVVVSAASLHAIVDEVRALRGRTEAVLVSSSGTMGILLASDPDFDLDADGQALVTSAAEQSEVRMVERAGLIEAAAALPGTPWVMLLRLPAHEVTAAIDWLLLWVVGAAVLVVGLGVLGLRKVLRPLTGVFIVQTTDMNRQLAEMRQAQAELAAKTHDLALSNAELQEYAYAASHDLQEPVRTIIGFAQLLSRRYRGQMGPEADEFIDFIIEGAERMRRQINDLLTYARLGRTDPALAPVDMNQVAAEARQALSAAIEERGASIDIAPLPTVLGGREALSRLLQNLIGNALKFSKPDQPPEVRVDAVVVDKWAEFRVRDNGIGIAPEYHDRVFRMFERLHPRGRYDGSGIGLAICRKVVEQHGGRIWVESATGQGCTIHFQLPLA